MDDEVNNKWKTYYNKLKLCEIKEIIKIGFGIMNQKNDIYIKEILTMDLK